MALRPYQEQALAHLHACFARGDRRVYFELPTGTGKTVILAQLARAYRRRGRVLAVAHRQELITQLADTLTHVLNEPVGVVMADRDEVGERVLVGTIQTLRPARLQRLLGARRDPLALLLLDEAHHVTPTNRYAALVREVESTAPDVVVVGCTATPYRMDRHRLQETLPVCAFARSIPDMQGDGWLAPLVWREVRCGALHLEEIPTRSAGGERDFDVVRLSAVLSRAPLARQIVRATASLLGGRPTLAFASSVAHAQALADAYRNAGLTAQAVWGDMPRKDRANTLREWKRGRVQVVTNCAVLTEGFDFPGLAALVMARPTQSPGFYVQCLGRGTRPAPGKTDCLVLDVTGHADPAETRQVLLPFILGVHGDGDGSAVSQVLDPTGRSATAWGFDAATGSYVTSIDRGIHAALVSDPTGSGLFLPLLLSRAPGATSMLTEHPVPLREVVWHVQTVIARNGLRTLSRKRAVWRDDEATEAQYALLFRLAPGVHATAREESWSKGTMSLRLDVEVNRARIEGLQQRYAQHAGRHEADITMEVQG